MKRSHLKMLGHMYTAQVLSQILHEMNDFQFKKAKWMNYMVNITISAKRLGICSGWFNKVIFIWKSSSKLKKIQCNGCLNLKYFHNINTCF